MADILKSAMSFLGMSDVVDSDEDFPVDEPEVAPSFDEDRSVTAPHEPVQHQAQKTRFPSKLDRITTIHPRSYNDAQMVGRAIRDGIPVVLNLTDVSEDVAYRIVDFSSGVVFGVRGSIERVTPRVFLLSPHQVNIRVEEPVSQGNTHDLLAD